MELTKVGEIIAPLSAGEVNISIGTNINDSKDGYFYFNTEGVPSLIDFKTLLAPKLTELPKLRPLLKDAIRKFGQVDELAKKLPEEKKYFKAYAEVLGRIGIVKSNDVSKIKEYAQIIKSSTTEGKKLYNNQGLKTEIDKIGVSPIWKHYQGHFAGTLGTPVCLTSDKEAIEKSLLFSEIANLLISTNITLMEPIAFLREANWVVKETGISLQSDGGVDFTELVLRMLNTSVADFSNMVKEGDGSAASLEGLGINTDKLAGAANNHTVCGASGNEKVRNACIALGGSPGPVIELEEVVTETEEAKEGSLLAKIITRLEAIETKYKTAPDPQSLALWGKIMQKFKALVSQKTEDELIKKTFGEWLEKYDTAKKSAVEESSSDNVVEDDEATLALREKIQGLEDHLNSVKVNSALGLEELVNEYSSLMGTCQQISVTPNYKVILKKAGDLKGQFMKVLDDTNAEIMNNQELKKELMRQIKETAKVEAEFKAEAKRLWEDFMNYTNTLTSPLVAQVALEKVGLQIKAFQQKVEDRSRGLILLSKKANIGNSAKISEHMTAVRSRVLKLKNRIEEQLKVTNNNLDLMEKLVGEFYENFDSSVLTKINKTVSDFSKLSLEL